MNTVEGSVELRTCRGNGAPAPHNGQGGNGRDNLFSFLKLFGNLCSYSGLLSVEVNMHLFRFWFVTLFDWFENLTPRLLTKQMPN